MGSVVGLKSVVRLPRWSGYYIQKPVELRLSFPALAGQQAWTRGPCSSVSEGPNQAWECVEFSVR